MNSNSVSVVPPKPMTNVQRLANKMMEQQSKEIKKTFNEEARQSLSASNILDQGKIIRDAVKEGRLTIEKVNKQLLGANKEALAAYNKLKPQYDAQVEAYITYAKNVKKLKEAHVKKMEEHKQAIEKLIIEHQTLLQTITQNREERLKKTELELEALNKEHAARIKEYLKNKSKLAYDLKTYLDANPFPKLPAKLPEPELTLPSEVPFPELSDSLVPPVPAGVLNTDERDSYFLQYKRIANDNINSMIDNREKSDLPSWNKFIIDESRLEKDNELKYKEELAKFEANILPKYIEAMKSYFETQIKIGIQQDKDSANYKALLAKYEDEVKSASEKNEPIPPRSDELIRLKKRINSDRAVPPPRIPFYPPIPPPFNSDKNKEQKFATAYTQAYKTNVDERIKAGITGEEINQVELPKRSDPEFMGGSYYDKYMKYKAKYIALKSNML